ncbi:MAG TPA: SGNH/GDSL hydrolase family protein [Blastococcus sp.]|nr:SGNH/GDSL hydrolase family protein [Blastococcus sp.]
MGDSITAGSQPLGRSPAPGGASWLSSLGGPPLEFTGGWAVPGATTLDMRAGVTPHPADVVVLMAGTNDLNRFAWATSAANLRAIVTTVGVAHVLVSAIPPNDRLPTERNTFNGRLRLLAAQLGWRFFDPWTEVSAGGRYTRGGTVDGVHPTVRTARAVGERIRAELLTYR